MRPLVSELALEPEPAIQTSEAKSFGVPDGNAATAQQPRLSQVTGRLRLSFDYLPHVQRTAMAVREQQPPLRAVRAFSIAHGAALAHLHNLSGGVLGGDRLELVVDMGAHARVQLTSTGATRVYRSRENLPAAEQRTELRVGTDGLLEYLPDPLIPYAGSRYQQNTRVELAPGAGLFWWEVVAPGREARGELFAYDLLQLNVDIVAGGRLVALERAKLEPEPRRLSSLARLGPYRYYATLYICQVGPEVGRWQALETELAELAGQRTRPGEIVWGVSMLPAHGLIVRGLSQSGRPVASALVEFWRAAKRALYGQDAVPPRKMY